MPGTGGPGQDNRDRVLDPRRGHQEQPGPDELPRWVQAELLQHDQGEARASHEHVSD